MSRQNLFTPELFASILEGLASGKSLRKICEPEEMPATSTVILWCSKDKELADQYARAREQGADAMADEIVDIADSAQGKEGAQLAKVRIDARIWHASKMRPKKYGDFKHLELTGKDGGPIEISLADRIKEARERAKRRG